MTNEEKNIIIAMVDSDASWPKTKNMINAMPVTEDIQKTGTWKVLSRISTLDQNGNEYIIHKVKCSNCRAALCLLDYDNYCPRCGSNNAFKE